MIRLEDVTFGWPGAAPLFSGLSLALPSGAGIAVTGPNGAGKSTLLRLIAGLERPQKGRIALGPEAHDPAMPGTFARHGGAVLQASDRHYVSRTVLQEVALGPKLLGLPDPEGLAHAALDRLGLAAHGPAHPLDLHAGARRLVSLAAAIAHRPRILLLDEVQRGLDRLHRARVVDLIATEAAAGATILIVSHDVEFLAATCRLRLVIDPGAAGRRVRLAEEGGGPDRR